jgi:hypothetical protein
MAVQQIIDVTADINATGRCQVDIGGFDYAVVQLVSPTATATFATTNDAGAITGSSDGNATSAINWVDVQGTNLNSGSAVSTLAASGIVRFQSIGQFLRIMGPALTVTKALIRLYKIN